MGNKLICFDVDGTLLENKSSWIDLTAGLGCSVAEVYSIFKSVINGKITFAQGEKSVFDIYRASGKATKGNIQKIFEKDIFKLGVAELIEYLKEKDYLIWLVSGSIDFHVKLVADKIGADGFFAHSGLEFDGDDNLSKINYPGDQNHWKVDKLRELSEKFKIPANEIIFVGDDINDLGAFRATGRGIAVWPYDEKLGAAAWKRVKSLSEIKDIL